MPPTPPDFDDLLTPLSAEEKNILALLVLLDTRSLPPSLMRQISPGKTPVAPARIARVRETLERLDPFKVKSPFKWESALLVRLLTHLFDTASQDLLAALERVLDSGPARYWYYSPDPPDTLPRDYAQFLFSLFSKNALNFKMRLESYESTRHFNHIFRNYRDFLVGAPLPREWIDKAPESIQTQILIHSVRAILETSAPVFEAEERLARLRALPSSSKQADLARRLCLHVDLLSGDREKIQSFLSTTPPPPLSLIQGISAWERFMAGDLPGAKEEFRTMASTIRRQETKKRLPLPEPFGIFQCLTLLILARSDPAARKDFLVRSSLATSLNSIHGHGYSVLEMMEKAEHSPPTLLRDLLSRLVKESDAASPLSQALLMVAMATLDPAALAARETVHLAMASRYRSTTPLVSALIVAAHARVAGASSEVHTMAARDEVLASFIRLFTPLFDSKEPWERVLGGLESLLGNESHSESPPESTKRIVWTFSRKTMGLAAFEETFKKGQWKRGKEIPLRWFLFKSDKMPLSEADKKVIKTFHASSTYQSLGEWGPDPIATPLALCGHPALYDHDHPDLRIEFEEALPELLIDEAPGGFRIGMSHQSPEPRVYIEDLSPTRYRVVNLTGPAAELSQHIPPEGLLVPAEARDRLLALLSRRTPFVEIRAEINASDLPAAEGDPSPILQISPLEDGISVVAGVRPFGSDGPFFSVGRGGRLVTCHGGSPGGVSPRHARRNHEEEISRLSALLDHLPLLKEQGSEEGIWTLPDPLSALECLEALAACPLPVTVEWPQGETLRTSPPVSMKKLRLTLRTSRDWFEVSGKVEVDESLVLDMKDLLDALPKARGRFVPLSDGRFLSLTQELKNRLERFAAISEEGGKISIPGTMALDDIFSEAGDVSGDARWKDFRKKVREAASYEPILPSTFMGDLRDYQREGFAWMSRLARWGAGACLADDMGLGKTVQTIAVMLDLSKGGPVLVVAPTSVCHNWETEISRFAPTLRVHELRSAPDRKAMVEALGPGEVLLASYGLLANEEALLTEKKWTMVVFDEAQAFKNAESKRAQAARKIDAEFRVALTGTPVENDLDELWSLFSVINPRLLGSRERFSSRFASPIERGHDPRVMAALRSLVRPFMLRRTKTAVLSELPPRTEITLDIELSTEERAFYEALRRKALETLEKLSGREKGSSRIHILAEITKLRRALCHPALVEPLTLLPGAKLDAFHLLVNELLSNRHKALVFSQFTGFLDRVAKSLDAKKIPYQYLDGSTPPKEREKRVAAFQAGQGDLFLISLRAGGTGLNLTAADYVIHLDPWWNPAVEDQASDRAHRIGQQRPVTIYRLIVRESIEEKILELHKKKRDLATDLLEGGEISGKLTNEELMALLGV